MQRKGKRLTRFFIVMAIIAVVPTLPYFLLNRESREMDGAARSSAAGGFVRLPDGTVHYELAGPSTGHPVVLIHGFSVPAYIWDGTFEALGRAGFRVLRYDLYGRGYSDRPDVTYDRALFIRQLAGLLDALALTTVDLVGLSVGGSVAASFTDEHPQRVRRLVLMDPAPSSPPPFSARILSAPLLGDYFFTVFGSIILPSGQKSDFHHAENMPPGYLERYRDQMTYRGFIHAILSTIRNLYPPGFMDVYTSVGGQKRPIMLIWGREDTTVPFADSGTIRELMPTAEFHAIDDTGHLPHIEAPAVVLGLLEEFLGR